MVKIQKLAMHKDKGIYFSIASPNEWLPWGLSKAMTVAFR